MREIRSNSESMTVTETAWWALATVLTVWSLLAVGLAQVGLFRGWALLAAGLLACMVGWGVVRIMKPLLRLRSSRRESLFLAVILAAGFGLFGWPAEHFPMIGDSSIYPNTAAMLIRTGGLEYHYDPLDGLTLEQRQLFYVPSDQQIPGVEIQSYQGLLYGAYYVTDADQNTVVSSRPPLAIAWMGLFGMLFGERGMLYVTPLFGAMSLAALYFLGKQVFDPGTGALAAVLLLVSFPQLHFSRTPYAEVMGQFFVLIAQYAWMVWLQKRRWIFSLVGVGALTVAFAARIDSVLAFPLLAIFVVLLAIREGWRELFAPGVGLVVAVAFTCWTINRPYVGVIAEMMLPARWPPSALGPSTLASLVGFLCLAVLLLALLVHYVSRAPVWRLARWGAVFVVILAVGYGLHIRPLRQEYATLMAVAAQYLSPLAFWLGALGAVLVLRQCPIALERMLLLFFVVSSAALFLWRYTTAYAYPVALRRLVPEVLPGFFLLGAFALRWIGKHRMWRFGALAVAGLTMALLMSVSTPYWFHREAEGTWGFLENLAKRLPSDAVVLFEPHQEDSVAGWFATPLWSFFGRRALLLNREELDGAALNDAMCSWQAQGREIYVVAWRNPADWWPGEFRGRLEGEVVWDSSIIGQSLRFPPYVWRFAFTFSIYQWEENVCTL